MSQINPFDVLAKQLLNAIPVGLRSLPNDIEKNFREILQNAFSKMNLVTRQEFEPQVEALKRTRAKLEALEIDFKCLEEKSSF